MKALDLFSCIGCHAIGFERAGIQTIGFCEIDEWRRQRVRQRFQNVRIHDDIKCLDPASYGDADVVIGGPPCQQTSRAAAVHGYRTGESLWPYMLRVVDLLRSPWVVVEQPTGNEAWETEVVGDLSRTGRHVARFEFGACDVGAPYLRRRVFMVACPSLSRLEVARLAIPRAIEEVTRAADARGDWNADQLASLPVDARAADEFDRGPKSRERQQWIEALGDSNPPHMAEVIGRAIMTTHPPAAPAVGPQPGEK
jgi:site-specific DNA-cytosine methylase